MTHLTRCLAPFLLALAATHHAAAAEPAAAPDRRQAAAQAAVARVFSLSILHKIDITIPAESVLQVGSVSEDRIRCTFTFDGTVLKDVGIRQAGGIVHAYRAINNKPSLSLRFDEFDKQQSLHGLDKLVLKNMQQDLSLMNEHLTYEVFRRAGLAAPMTAYAAVTINGLPSGIYLMREPVNKAFLLRNFGPGNETGNLYEFDVDMGDFVNYPSGIDLKNEESESRSRSDIVRLAATVTAAPPEFFAPAVSSQLNLERYLTYLAVEAVTSDMDGFSFNNNNSYMYAMPADGRFVFFPHGADEAFWATGTPVTRLSSPFMTPRAQLARKVQSVPQLMEKYREEVARVGQPPVWDQPALLARVAEIAKLFSTAEDTGRTKDDLALSKANRPTVEMFIKSNGLAGVAGR